jgi:hypothetical protein
MKRIVVALGALVAATLVMLGPAAPARPHGAM